MRRSVSILVPAVALWALAVVSAVQVTRNAPAFNDDLRQESVFGDWRVDERQALLDRSDYHFHLGFGYLRGDAAALMLGGTDLPTKDEFEDNVRRSIDLFEASIATAPGHVTAWTNLAWSHFLTEDLQAAQVALAASWRLAPFDVSEARERLGVVGALSTVHGLDLDVPEGHLQSIENDLELLSRFDPWFLDALRDDGFFWEGSSD